MTIQHLINNPTAQVKDCGGWPDEMSTVVNHTTVREGERLYSKEQLEKAFKIGLEHQEDSEEENEIQHATTDE